MTSSSILLPLFVLSGAVTASVTVAHIAIYVWAVLYFPQASNRRALVLAIGTSAPIFWGIIWAMVFAGLNEAAVKEYAIWLPISWGLYVATTYFLVSTFERRFVSALRDASPGSSFARRG